MLDSDLADLYLVPTKSLNLAVRRNFSRFPPDFMFQLTKEEAEALRFQIETSKAATDGRGGRRYLPYAFTEHGAAMLSSVLRSERAVQMNILIVRAFIKLRDMLLTHKEFAARIDALEANQQNHASVINVLAAEIDELKQFPDPPSRSFGFKPVN